MGTVEAGHGGRPAVFLDRDGTVIEDVGYPRDPDSVRLLPGAPQTLAALHDAGLALVVVSNQSGVGRGIIAPAQAEAVHARFVALLADAGVQIDAVRYCPHAPDEGCACRKPSPEMLLDAARELGIDRSRSTMIGDRASDLQAGRRAGTRTILLANDPGHAAAAAAAAADQVARDWSEIAALLLPVTAR
jgi:D-glycero-D-manno-heptose 1,7-bisphosphate phosphatase